MMSDHSRAGVAELLELALVDPVRAEARATEILGGTPDAWWQSVARHALGLALRESGDMQRAVPELRAALRFAERSADRDRTADVRATLGLTLVTAGRTHEGLSQLGRAVTDAHDPDLTAKVLMRRGLALSWVLGRHDEGLIDLTKALDGFRAVADPGWEARTRNLLGLCHLTVGDVAAAEEQVLTARDHFVGLGYEGEAVMALHNLGIVALVKGDLPTALATFDEADERYTALEMDTAALTLDRSTALLSVGLADEAVRVVDTELRRTTTLPTLRPQLELELATAQLASGNARAAYDHARAALGAFRRSGRDWHAARAELEALRAREHLPRADRRMLPAARRVAAAIEAEGSGDAAAAWLLAGRLATRSGNEAAGELLDRAAAYRTARGALVRATGWLGAGLERELAGDRRGVFRACRRGLDEIDAHRSMLGSSELRALSTGHGEQLARLALGHAVEGPPRPLLWWSERWRATSLTQPPVRPAAVDEVSAPLAALRDNARRLLDARRGGEDAAVLEAERSRLEDEVRRRLRRVAGVRGRTGGQIDVADLVEEVGDAAFVELVEVGTRLHALLVHGGRVRKVLVGRTADAVRAVDYALYTLRQAARARPVTVGEAGLRLQDALLGEVARHLRGRPAVIVSPTSRLHNAPWGLIPVLTDLPHSVVPSAGLWMRARARRSTSDRRVFVCGPGLTTGGAEVDVVSRQHPGGVVLRDGAATVERSLAALDGAALAHIAAHGHFRDDSPFFSSLDLDDGPLTVHDFERMVSAPHRVVLSACESGAMAPVGAGELLGLVSALLSVGTAGVAAATVVVNDDATVDLMVDLHAGLENGDDLATALLGARRSAQGDPVREATAASFLALGV